MIRTMGFSFHPWTFRTIRITDFSYHPWTFRTVIGILLVSIDYVIVRHRDVKDATLTRFMRGAECWTDHRLVRATFQLRVRPVVRKQKPRRRLDVKACQNPEKADTLCELIHEKLLLERR